MKKLPKRVLVFPSHSPVLRNIDQKNEKETEENMNFRRNQAHMVFTERDVLYLCKDCKYTADLVFADIDFDHFYLVQAAVW